MTTELLILASLEMPGAPPRPLGPSDVHNGFIILMLLSVIMVIVITAIILARQLRNKRNRIFKSE